MIVITNKGKQESRITKQLVKIAINSEDTYSRDQFLSFVVLNGSDKDILAVADLVKKVTAKTKKIADKQNALAIEASLRWQAKDIEKAKEIIEVEKILAVGKRKERNRLSKLIEWALKSGMPASEFRNAFVIN
jgi:3-oxoacyl-(acyl-carrier-protein) synthase